MSTVPDIHLFSNMIKSLWNIDGWLLPELTSEQQKAFVNDPHRYFAHADYIQQQAIYREVLKRQK